MNSVIIRSKFVVHNEYETTGRNFDGLEHYMVVV